MQVSLVDGSVHSVPDWFLKIPMIEACLEDVPDEGVPIPLPDIFTQTTLYLFIGTVQLEFSDLSDHFMLVQQLLMCGMTQLVTTLDLVKSAYIQLVPGMITQGLVNRIEGQDWKKVQPVFAVQPNNVQESVILQMAFQNPIHPMIDEYFSVYIFPVLEKHPWAFWPTTGIYQVYLEKHTSCKCLLEVLNVIFCTKPYERKKQIITRGIFPLIDQIDLNKENDEFVLSVTLFFGNFTFAEKLVQLGSDLNYISGRHTPLMDVVTNCNLETCEWMIDHGADPNVCPKNTYGPLQAWVERVRRSGQTRTYRNFKDISHIKSLAEHTENMYVLKVLVKGGVHTEHTVDGESFEDYYRYMLRNSWYLEYCLGEAFDILGMSS